MSRLPRLLLGPQRPDPNIGAAVAAAELPPGPLAVISAGWQEAEGDLEELETLVGRPLLDLQLYQRAERLFESDPTLYAAYRLRQDRLMALQRLYRLRLRRLAIAAREMLEADVDSEFRDPELRHAISQLRALDRHHLGRTEDIQHDFTREFHVTCNDAMAEQAAEITSLVDGCPGFIITGGNVLVLLNRIRLFGVDALLRTSPLIAWSAGTMVLADRVVLYHDRTPGRRRDPELLGSGLGLLPGYVLLPDARRRLREDEPSRHALLSRRFAPAACVLLDNGATLQFDAEKLLATERTRRITHGGELEALRAA